MSLTGFLCHCSQTYPLYREVLFVHVEIVPDPVNALLLDPGQQHMDMTLLSCKLSTV